MSRLPRAQEYLKTGFAAEAASAAKFRAFARRAERDGRPQLAAAWQALAAEKDALAISQLEATGQVRGGELDLLSALAEERYENESLYPRMASQVEEPAAGILRAVAAGQVAHAERLARLADELRASIGDVRA